jgi:alkaline phosphatase D
MPRPMSDLPDRDPPPGITRRRAIAAGAGVAGALATGPLLNQGALARDRKKPVARDGSFDWGVSAGFPLPYGVVLWTRVGGLDRTSRVTLEVARDRGFRKVVHRSKVLAEKNRDYTVHARVRQLRPHTEYFYRFATRNSESRVGRFRTAPPRKSDQPVRIGFFSCQAWQAGYFNAHSGLAAEQDLDLVICLGDYIYENATYSGARTDDTGTNGDGDCQTFPEYRDKYRFYQSDPQLQEMHANHAFVAIWDDHEVEDNYAGDKASSAAEEGMTNAGEARRVPIAKRQRNGYKAFFEAMPRIQRNGDPNRIYGKAELGQMADLYMLDQRQYRAQQPCNDGFFTPCIDSGQPRDYLGPRQLGWLKNRLARTESRWKVLGNQLMLMAFDVAPGVPVVQDSWEGYQAERRELTDHIVGQGVDNVVALTGDIHTFFAGTVTNTGRIGGTPAATEFVGGSITSLGVKETLAPVPVENLEAAVQAVDPHMVYADFDRRGYGVLTLDAEKATCEFKTADTLSEGGATELLASFEVSAGELDVRRTD